MDKTRVINYQMVVERLNADIVALQEVRDRYALERFFPAVKWDVIIDDDSTDDMNLAFAVRKGLIYRLESGQKKNVDKDFDCAICDNSNLRIESLLPNPIENDSGNEIINIKNMVNILMEKLLSKTPL
ncbi:TPA: hypothetical protein ACX6QA_000079 [Photobacterium damselae]